MYKITEYYQVPENSSQYIPSGYEGNVNLLRRPGISASYMRSRGWTDVDEGYATVYTSTYSAGDTSDGFDFPSSYNSVINVTPIMDDGSVLTPGELEDYIAEIVESKTSKNEILQADKNAKMLFLSVTYCATGADLDAAYEAAGEWAENLHLLQEELYEYQWHSDDNIIYYPPSIDEHPCFGGHLTTELNQAGNLSFVIVPGHPLYERLDVMSTYLSVYDDSTEVFFGRIISMDSAPFTGQLSVECEGAYAFLDDSEVPPDPKGSEGTSMTAQQFFERCITVHNEFVKDIRRTFVIGEISHSKKNQVDTYQISSYTSVKNCIESMLLSKLGGFIRIREQNGWHVIDWIENYTNVNRSPIQIGENVVDLNTRKSVEDLYTVLRPVGADGLLLPEETIDVYSASDMARYGRVVKTVTYSDIKDVAQLRAKANALISRITKSAFINSEIKVVDMHFLDGSAPKIQLGDAYTNIHGIEDVKMTVANLERDFDNPANDHLGFKNPKDLEVSDLDGTSSSGKGANHRSSVGGLGQRFKYIFEQEEELTLATKKIGIHAEELDITANDLWFATHALESSVSEILGSALYVNKDNIVSIVGEFSVSGSGENRVLKLKDGTDFSITKDGATITTGSLKQAQDRFEGSALWTQRDNITAITGEYSIEVDPVTGKKKLKVKSGTDFTVNKDGAEISVADSYLYLSDKVSVFEGSALWTQRDNITGVVGEYDILIDPVTGKKTLVIKAGGGIKIRRDNTEFGLYDEGNLDAGVMVSKLNADGVEKAKLGFYDNGNLTAGVIVERFRNISSADKVVARTGLGFFDNETLTGGIMVDKLNDDSVTTKIKGDRVDIEASQVKIGSTSTVAQWMSDTGQDIENLEGIVADKATIADLNALRVKVGDIEADYITTNNLAAEFGNITGSLLLGGNLIVTGSGSITVAASRMTFSNAVGSETTTRTPKDFIRSVQVVPDGTSTYKLQYQLAFDSDSTWRDAGTFDRAAPVEVTLSGSWSGGVLTVTPSPSGQPWIRSFVQDTPEWTGYDVSIPVHVHRTAGSSDYDEGAIMSTFVSVPSNLRYSTGQNDVTITKGPWSNGIISFTKSAGTASTKSVQLCYKTTWSGNDASIDIWDGTAADASHGVYTGYTVPVNASGRFTAGQNSVTLTSSGWSSGKITFDKSAGTSSPKSVQLTAAAPTWSGDTASVDIWDGTAADTSHGVSTGYTVKVNASGRFTAGQNSVTITTTKNWSGGKITFDKSAGTSSPKTVQLCQKTTWSGNTASVAIWDGTAADTSHGSYTGYTVSVDASGRYNAGGATAKVAITKGSTPLDYGKSVTVTAQYVNASGTTVSTSRSITITAPADNKGTGWSLAVEKVVLPKSNTSATMSVTTPGSTYGQAGATSYVVSADNTYAYVKISGTTTVVARATHSAFSNGQTDGRNGVTLTSSGWSKGKITFNKSVGTSSPKTVQLCQKTTWSGNTASVAIWDGTAADTSHGVSTGYTVSVDASERYNAGWTDYYNSSYWAKATRANSFNAKIPNSTRNGSENWDCGVSAALSLYLNNSPSGWKKPADGVSWNVCYPNPSSIGSSDNDAFPTPVTWFSAQPSVSNVQWYPSDSSSWPASGPYDANTAFSSLASMILAHTTKKDRGYIYFDVNVNNKFRRYYIAIG